MRTTTALAIACAIIAAFFVLSDSGVHPSRGPGFSARLSLGLTLVADGVLIGYMIDVLRAEAPNGRR